MKTTENQFPLGEKSKELLQIIRIFGDYGIDKSRFTEENEQMFFNMSETAFTRKVDGKEGASKKLKYTLYLNNQVLLTTDVECLAYESYTELKYSYSKLLAGLKQAYELKANPMEDSLYYYPDSFLSDFNPKEPLPESKGSAIDLEQSSGTGCKLFDKPVDVTLKDPLKLIIKNPV